MNQYYVDPSLVIGLVSQARYIWLLALMRRLNRPLTYPDIIAETLRQGATAPFWQIIRGQTDAQLIMYAMRVKLRGALRGIRFIPVGMDKPYRVLVSAKLRTGLALVPVPYVERTLPLYNATLRRAVSFRNAWQQHRADLMALHRVPRRTVYWRPPPPPPAPRRRRP